MTTEELLKPRYQTIAIWPNSHPDILIGKLLASSSNNMIKKLVFCVGGDSWLLQEEVQKYPHLFRKLEWWEERKPEDLPAYVKDLHGEVFRVEEYSNNSYISLYKNFPDYHFPFGGHSLYELFPATEREYVLSKEPNPERSVARDDASSNAADQTIH